jgi:hypothetical protein
VIAIRRQHGLESERFDRVTVTMAHARRSECSFTSRPKTSSATAKSICLRCAVRCKVANSRPNQTGREFGQEVIEQRAITRNSRFAGEQCLHMARYFRQHRSLGPSGSCLARQHQPCCDRLCRLNQYGGRAIPSARTTAGGLPTTRVLSPLGLPTTRVLWLSGLPTTGVLSGRSLSAVSGRGSGRRRGGVR